MKSNLVKNKIHLIYQHFYSFYGPQGWWPLSSRTGTPGFDSRGYHKNDFSSPSSRDEIFEVLVGAILTQNTTWKNAEKALRSMMYHGLVNPMVLMNTPVNEVAGIIRSSGYYNQKAKKLKIIAEFFETGNFGRNNTIGEEYSPGREELLSLWGIGPETADSILLYGFKKPYFVVDAYTKRILTRLGVIRGNETYGEIQIICSSGTEEMPFADPVHYYNEYHALFVIHGKIRCKTKPECTGCPLISLCEYG
jgi:endonuclease-3 related protein